MWKNNAESTNPPRGEGTSTPARGIAKIAVTMTPRTAEQEKKRKKESLIKAEEEGRGREKARPELLLRSSRCSDYWKKRSRG